MLYFVDYDMILNYISIYIKKETNEIFFLQNVLKIYYKIYIS